MKTAKRVRYLPDWRGCAALYKLSEPITKYTGEECEYVIVSAVGCNRFLKEPETYIFPSDAQGNDGSMVELPGSERGTLSHTVVLRNAGYEIQEKNLAN